MKAFELLPFRTPDSFAVFPSLTVAATRCEDPACDSLHGYEIGLQWGTVGIAARIIL